MPQSVRAVERALDVLLCITSEKPPRSLTQIAESVHMSKATVHRLLVALEKKRFVTKNLVPGRYCLDSRFIEMAALSQNIASRKRPARLTAGRKFKDGYIGF